MKNNKKKITKTKDYKKQKGEILIAASLGLCAVVGVFLSSKVNIKSPSNVGSSGDSIGNKIETIETVNLENEIKLPTFSSKKEILKLVEKNKSVMYLYDNVESDMASISTSAGIAQNTNSVVDKSYSESTNSDYSETNTQVEGVDEGDIVKTNGNFIYYISERNLYIFNTQSTETKLVKTIEIGKDYDYYPEELYIDDKYITVIAQEYVDRIEDDSTMVTSMYVYDINSYDLVKNVKTEGNYISSRKIGSNIYMVTNRYLYSYRINEKNVLPIYMEECNGNSIYSEIPAQDIMYFPDIKEGNECHYMIITSIDLSNINNEATIDTYLGSGTEIYCSAENLYVTRIENNYAYAKRFTDVINFDVVTDTLSQTINNINEESVTTKIHKFNLLDGAVKYVATGEVPGSLLNQYSMDENNGYFRITTTSDNGNSLYVLNDKLEIVGELENLAKGERIYATRFMGDKCYLVTYKTVDPLFVIDLSNPENPTVLGELKIPGYSTYLHPLGDNYLIGFGEDSVEKSYIDWEGNSRVTAYNVGLKLAIFDISDLNNPKELHSIKIGGRGSTSELLNNPKSLYFDKEAGIFAFTASLREETKFYEDGTPMYGDIIFKGALVYNLDVEDGISLRGKIEHEGAKSYYTNVERIISIGDNFYTISPEMIKVTNIETMEEVKEGRCEFGSEKIKPILYEKNS